MARSRIAERDNKCERRAYYSLAWARSIRSGREFAPRLRRPPNPLESRPDDIGRDLPVTASNPAAEGGASVDVPRWIARWKRP